jgi:predicted GNAT family acetyltransferase
MNDVEVHHQEAAERYELHLDGEIASILDYHVIDGRIVFHHTETSARFRGRGLAAQVVKVALDDARANGQRVVPACWFVAEYIDEHPEYRELVAAAPAV